MADITTRQSEPLKARKHALRQRFGARVLAAHPITPTQARYGAGLLVCLLRRGPRWGRGGPEAARHVGGVEPYLPDRYFCGLLLRSPSGG
jgi:hypothetical protein